MLPLKARNPIENLGVLFSKILMNFHPRHGTLMAITLKELNTLILK
jgi:hypothetical protein